MASAEEKKLDLVIVQGRSKDAERATIPFSLAGASATKHGKSVQVVLMFDGANLAIPETSEKIVAGKPFDGNLLERIQNVIKAGVKVAVCKPCLMKRGLLDKKLIDGIEIISGLNLLQYTYGTEKVLSFT
eukprot:CAMPEP_0185251932 /NCGR_PEP_ID=MMETSP1359-20130426/1212_1 /TAXON_ID=552665 /ORGANISM="Bigelowiella longifila, Strain CCMP242" /LENGTH=129 /DNA_ID=CAMNT_0027833995 /DNA_START=35 /DNA_END=424 /DNA_ORIENTATION=-